MSESRNRKRTLTASGARTTTYTGPDQKLGGYRGVRVTVNVTAVTSTPSTTFKIQRKNADGTYTDVLASAAVTATGTIPLTVYPGLTAAANSVANDHLGDTFRFVAVHGNANAMTYNAVITLLK